MPTIMDFSDKTVIITGAAGALGSVVAKSFLTQGATVALIDIKEEAVKTLAEEYGAKCKGYVCNLIDENMTQNVVRQILSDFGKIDILANIAGGFTMGGRTHETDLDTIQKMLDYNFKTMFILSKSVLPNMIKNQFGKIVNVGARAGLKGSAQMGPYVGSKSLVIRTTETMAREYLEDNINVNCILPGTIDTEQNRKDMPDADFDKWVPPQDLANVVLFLSSEEAISVTGASVPVYGKTL